MWTDTKYLQCADQPAWEALVAAMGKPGAGEATIFLCADPPAPWQTPPVWGDDEDGVPIVTTPGVPMSGYWVMLRLNQDWEGWEAAQAAIETAGVLHALVDPPWVFA